MNRKQKEIVIHNFLGTFNLAKSVFVIDFVGVDSYKVTAFKKKLFGINSKMMIMKNSLLKIAAKENPVFGKISGSFVNQIALVYALKDSFATANALNVFIKNMKNINFKLGLFENSLIEESAFNKIANLTSEKTLYAQLCGVIRNPIIQLVYIFNQIVEKQRSNENKEI